MVQKTKQKENTMKESTANAALEKAKRVMKIKHGIKVNLSMEEFSNDIITFSMDNREIYADTKNFTKTIDAIRAKISPLKFVVIHKPKPSKNGKRKL